MSAFKKYGPEKALAISEFSSAGLFLILDHGGHVAVRLWLAGVLRHRGRNLAGVAIGRVAWYYTSSKPVTRIIQARKPDRRPTSSPVLRWDGKLRACRS